MMFQVPTTLRLVIIRRERGWGVRITYLDGRMKKGRHVINIFFVL
jgi:hypothetical protein